VKAIASDANPTFKRWLKLATQPRSVRAEGRTLAEGIHLLQAACDAKVPVSALILRRGADGAELAATVARVAALGVPSYELAPGLFDRLAPVQNSVGAMIEIEVPRAPLPNDLTDDLLYLDGVQDPGNAGALLRVAAGAGLRWVLAGPGTAALWAPRALRAGQGAHFHLHIVENVEPVLAAAQFRGTWLAADAHGATSLWTLRLPDEAIGWVFGAEGQGVSAAMLDLCRQRVCVPLQAVESLNVTAAAAVCLFERRRRLQA
jgi:TrmH family RNA methyltransferase